MMNYTLKDVNLDVRATHAFIAHADDIISEAMLRIWYNADSQGLKRIDSRDKAAVENARTIFCFDFNGGRFDHHSPHDREIRYPNRVIMASCGKILAAAVNDGYISEYIAEYIRNHGLYAVEAADNGQDYNGFHRPFQVLTLMSEPDSDFEELVAMATKILQKLLNDAEKYIENLSVFKDALKTMDEFGIVRSEYIPNFNEMAITENFNRMYVEDDKNLINFHIFPSLRGGFMTETVKRGFGSFSDRIPFDPIRDKVDGVIFIHPSGFLCHAETEEACREACKSALSRYTI